MLNLKYYFLALILGSFLVSCNQNKKITNRNDYGKYLNQTKNITLINAEKELNYWTDKLQKTPNQFPYLSKLANANALIFQATGNIEYLKAEEDNWLKINAKTGFNKAAYLRALARNYISQHRFKEALTLLEKAEINGENLSATQKMLFDVHMELGNVDQAGEYLARVRNFDEFDYLIRISKWSDHFGKLDFAIKYMEKAMRIAEASKNTSLQEWSYTNLADFYGHAGKINDAYEYYLKALELNPNDDYALKGIAWIAFSHERDTKSALEIVDFLISKNHSPDYYLLKAEIADYNNDFEEKSRNLTAYFNKVENADYGQMYNKYNTLLLTEETQKISLAMKIAEQEVNQRPTPQSYGLLAWVHFKNGNSKKAVEIMEEFVANQTFEPEIQYHFAEILKANGRIDEAINIKKELVESSFELGPNLEKKINSL